MDLTSKNGENIIFGTSSGDYLEGTEGDDIILGFGGNDYIKALGGNDLVFGGEGDDIILGGMGRDTLYGNDGDDLIFVGATEGAVDTDRNVAHGNGGDDIIVGEHGKDRLYGDEGNDRLEGGEGADVLEGGAGSDVLTGNSFGSTLPGGPPEHDQARDVFVFDGNSGYDTIVDFEKGHDKIDLSAIADHFSDLWFDPAGPNSDTIYVGVDGESMGVAVMGVAPGAGLDASDFILGVAVQGNDVM